MLSSSKEVNRTMLRVSKCTRSGAVATVLWRLRSKANSCGSTLGRASAATSSWMQRCGSCSCASVAPRPPAKRKRKHSNIDTLSCREVRSVTGARRNQSKLISQAEVELARHKKKNKKKTKKKKKSKDQKLLRNFAALETNLNYLFLLIRMHACLLLTSRSIVPRARRRQRRRRRRCPGSLRAPGRGGAARQTEC